MFIHHFRVDLEKVIVGWYLGVILKNSHHYLKLGSQVNFEDHLKSLVTKSNKTEILFKLNILSRPALVTLNENFIRPHLDHDDILFKKNKILGFIRSYNPFNKESTWGNMRYLKGRTTPCHNLTTTTSFIIKHKNYWLKVIIHLISNLLGCN